jgi:uracil-DNA glycosylase
LASYADTFIDSYSGSFPEKETTFGTNPSELFCPLTCSEDDTLRAGGMRVPSHDDAILAQLAKEAETCRRCPLYRVGTNTVFGEGPAAAQMMIVGEQPGDREDLSGRPFVGPAGHLLDKGLALAGIDRSKAYLTNVVKHFKNEPRGKRRLHKRPNTSEIQKCRWWLDREIAAVRPKLIVALGVTAAQTLLGKSVVLSRKRGLLLEFPGAGPGLATVHPSSILRSPDKASRERSFVAFVRDLKRVRNLLSRHDIAT